MLWGVFFMEEIDLKKELNKKNKIIGELKLEIELLKKENERLKKEAYLDTLTQLNNRRILENVNDFDSIIIGDIDHFKRINDSYGHLKGDEVLIAISQVLNECVRDTDIVCRWGGEEFVILLKNCTDKDAFNKAMLLKEKISELEKTFGFEITMSFGVSNFLFEKPMKKAINEADKALYKSKQNGRNKVTMYKE